MKKTLIVIRWVVGLLFIFSGLIKANDPLGLSYKMQEFFDVWGLSSLNNYTLALSLVMNVFEVLAGVAVIIGWNMKLFSWLLLLLIIFFCFLTGYAYLTGNIKTCGCFGDCIPLTAQTSFIKDLVLLVLILVLFVNRKNIHSSLKMPLPAVLLLLCIIAVTLLQNFVLQHLPVKDCLPYSVGSNILQNMKVLPGQNEESKLVFKYKKDGKIMEFPSDSLPADLDSTYEYVDRYQKVLKEGTPPKITDFNLLNTDGADTTMNILSQPNYYVMLFANDFSTYNSWHTKDFDSVVSIAASKHLPFYIVTSDREKAMELFGKSNNVNVLIADNTVIKTAARVNATYFLMQMADVKGKYSCNDMDKVLAMVRSAPVNTLDEDQ